MGSMWAMGLSETRPSSWAVGSPIRFAAQPWDASWMVMAKSRTNRLMTIDRTSMVNRRYL